MVFTYLSTGFQECFHFGDGFRNESVDSILLELLHFSDRGLELLGHEEEVLLFLAEFESLLDGGADEDDAEGEAQQGTDDQDNEDEGQDGVHEGSFCWGMGHYIPCRICEKLKPVLGAVGF